MANISFILNGKIKSKRLIQDRLVAAFDTKEYSLHFFETKNVGHAMELVKDAVDCHSDYIIVIGGDGTLNEVVNGYMKYALHKNSILGVLPAGTGNDFSKTIKITSDPKQLVKLIGQKSYINIDVGEINFNSTSKKNENRFYINISDIGIGGVVVKRLAESSRILGANLTYIKAIVQSFLSFKPAHVKLVSDSFEWEGKAMSICLANGKYFGSGMCIAPKADITDGKIALVILGDISLFDYIRNLSKIKKGEILNHPKISYESISSCKIYSNSNQCPIDMDGEYIGEAPLSLKVHKQVLPFLVGN